MGKPGKGTVGRHRRWEIDTTFAVLTWWRSHWWRFADCHQVIQVHKSRVLTQETMRSLLLLLFVFQWISQQAHIKGVWWHCSTCMYHIYIVTFIFTPISCSHFEGVGKIN
jgi:hypothetical protein